MKLWKVSGKNPEYIRNTPITSNMYLPLSEISEAIKRNSHYAYGILVDIGAGNAPYKPFFKGKVKEYITMDDPNFKGNKPDIFGNTLNLPFKDNSIDTIFSSQVLEHIPTPHKMINEIYRVLNKKGICILTTHMANPLHGEPHDYFRFTKYGLKQLFNKFDKIEKIEENGGALLSISQFIIWGINEKLPKIISFPIITISNKIIKKLDKLFYDPRFTTNYIIIARK